MKAVFLDRDGTIIEDVNYLSRLKDIRLIDKAKEALEIFKENGFKIIVVSNQSGVGRGYFSSDFVKEANDIINRMVDGLIDGFYFCPHLPEDNCSCRKPKTGMVDAAIRDFNLSKEGSFVIGDKESDVELGINAGIEPVLILTGYGKKYKDSTKANLIFENIYEAAKWICQKGSME
ncbi:D-glycero-alpha-D-manno-heptose-1,7-bisphosphate 7-phosphatase [Hippea maritima]|uniref:D,D-heptose 1,7-bisphosphate phosphatase n=1 Tax=Hippea maritima (strain ATCC 700847 / DSM 10411 / MH2) TaxID=760142 RepID=F2LU17_HIPMA|nr:HAD family hydrolase [Hippea maritima]AEA33416.1 histidinol-phosphate phosphatase family protein [Hippea maritima DSM 10411]